MSKREEPRSESAKEAKSPGKSPKNPPQHRTQESASPKSTERKKPGAEIKAKNVNREEAQFLEEHQEGLSKTTQRAKWIHRPDEHEDHPGQSLATRSHEVIEHWASDRQAKPATVPDTEHGDRPGVLRLDFPGYGGRHLETISWEDWFQSFDERRLVFLFQEHKSDGTRSNFFRLDNPERENA